ncbi:hypothetical protein B0H63DRAFT_462859 [Podospora didyma]|uniref:Transcription initiation factor TFIID subunit 8 n=1 Tax=Podospora didyma TaxID=330526 RepID=A0AAE0U995_9PEZI|nr:hypothetical protein B0H63DRAFT_462859 [Podospora didyma]
MSPARAEDSPPAAMASESRKRPAEAEAEAPQQEAKRQRIEAAERAILVVGNPADASNASKLVTTEELAKSGLRRSIALSLQQAGFDSSAPDAMESFMFMAETYLSQLVNKVKMFANASRRSHAIPRDFEESLKAFGLTTSALQPQKKTPIPKSKRIPTYEPLPNNDPIIEDLPILGEELDGAADKASKPYIPSSFPPFPSIHTYKYTPESVEAESVTDDWGAFGPEVASQSIRGTESSQPKGQRPLAPEEIPRGDPKKLREAAAKEAKAGEFALRRLMRASKIAKQKEVWSSAQREPARRERYNLWEAAMRELIEEDDKSKGKEVSTSAMHGEKGRFEIADHSMIVNADKRFYRKEVPRTGSRKAAAAAVQAQGAASKA